MSVSSARDHSLVVCPTGPPQIIASIRNKSEYERDCAFIQAADYNDLIPMEVHEMGGRQFPKPVAKKSRGEKLSNQEEKVRSAPSVPSCQQQAERTLYRSSVESPLFFIISVLLAVVPMRWWLRGIGLLILIPIACDLIWRTSWKVGPKLASCTVSVGLVILFAYLVLPAQYRKEHSPIVSAKQSSAATPPCGPNVPTIDLAARGHFEDLTVNGIPCNTVLKTRPGSEDSTFKRAEINVNGKPQENKQAEPEKPAKPNPPQSLNVPSFNPSSTNDTLGKPVCNVNVAVIDTDKASEIQEAATNLVAQYADGHGQCPKNDWLNGKLSSMGYRVFANVNCEARSIGIRASMPNVRIKGADMDLSPCTTGIALLKGGDETTFGNTKISVTVTGGSSFHIDSVWFGRPSQ
ncbi:MAG TPA: hypothetical protein VGS27_02090 [Candidatus Sulfotelmatobacter sp.]|nr:hypothetical protein [Candidatus Sulfotelmatobacter sp.]